ncbi:MAG: hypothetical protein AABZ12_10730 [Planctomycetota bacterium]
MPRSPWQPWIDVGVGLLVLLTIGLTLLAIYLVWRDGYVKGWRKARERPPVCPKCGYSLRGLTHCRCPECGTEYELEELWRSPIVAFGSGRKDDGRAKGDVESRK